MQGRARRFTLFTAVAGAMTLCPVSWAGKAHEHGVARLDIGVEVGRITLSLEVPLEDLVGFERAPRTEAERAAVVAALARLQEAGKLIRVDSAAGCGPAKVVLEAAAWRLGASSPAASAPAPASSAAPAPPAAPAREPAHGDLEATYEFRCSNAPRAAFVEIGLFEAFARLRRIEVQAVAARGQMKLVLRRPQTRVGLAR